MYDSGFQEQFLWLTLPVYRALFFQPQCTLITLLSTPTVNKPQATRHFFDRSPNSWLTRDFHGCWNTESQEIADTKEGHAFIKSHILAQNKQVTNRKADIDEMGKTSRERSSAALHRP